MKKALLIIILGFSSVVLFAQKSNIGRALIAKEEGKLDEAYSIIMKALDPENPKAESTINFPRTWIAKGEILLEVGRIGLRNITYEPLLEAHSAFKKAMELDTKGRSNYSLIPNFKELQKQLSIYGKTSYNQRRFDISSKCFLAYMEIEFLPIMEDERAEKLDTVITYNAGLAAYEAEKWNYVIDYFGLAEKNGCVTPVGSFCIANAYNSIGDSVKALNMLEKGIADFPGNEKIGTELIRIYLNKAEYQKALAIIDDQLKVKPEDIMLLMRKGRTLEKLGKENEAIALYTKAINFDNSQFTPYYNLGVIYFNKGVSVINQAINLPENEDAKFEQLSKQGKEQLELCLPYFEKAYQLKPAETDLLRSLSYIYKQLDMTEKFEEAERKLKI